MQRGVTLIEVMIALAVVSVLTIFSVPRIGAWGDRLAVRRAEEEAAAFYHRVRETAVYRSVRVRLTFTDESLAAVLEDSPDSIIAEAPGPMRHGVSLDISRRVVRLYPNGFGLGAANTKLVFRRGDAVDSLTISRLGRLRRSS